MFKCCGNVFSPPWHVYSIWRYNFYVKVRVKVIGHTKLRLDMTENGFLIFQLPPISTLTLHSGLAYYRPTYNWRGMPSPQEQHVTRDTPV